MFGVVRRRVASGSPSPLFQSVQKFRSGPSGHARVASILEKEVAIRSGACGNIRNFCRMTPGCWINSKTMRVVFHPEATMRTWRHPFSSVSGETSDAGATTEEWEEEDEAEPKIGDGGDGGGVALQNVPWGQRALSIAEEVLLDFNEDIKLYAFKTTPRGYVYVRLDKLSDEYGCPSMEELECYNQKYKKRLDEVGALGEIPDDLALEVSSPGAERVLKVPDDLSRFKDMPMRVCYTENVESNCPERDGVFLLDSIEEESEMCVWKLADVKENRDLNGKGRPLSRKQKDWRLKLPFNLHRIVTLDLHCKLSCYF